MALHDNETIWAQLIHLGYNMWSDRDTPEWNIEYTGARSDMSRFEKPVWDAVVSHMSGAGVNMIVIDLGEGVAYESHPEIGVAGSWTTKQLRAELGKLRDMGLEPIPKLNFSTGHDAWMGDHARRVSTPEYYTVCSDLIAEVSELFDGPRLFHLGMDEETQENQQFYEISIVRQYDLWWHDFLYLVEQVEAGSARAWIWSDYLWDHPGEFFARMPKSVVQSNWYYGYDFHEGIPGAKAYLDLEAHGYDQIPTGSNWTEPQNFEKTVRYTTEHVAPERLMGFLQTIWKPTVERRKLRHIEGADEVGLARKWYEARG